MNFVEWLNPYRWLLAGGLLLAVFVGGGILIGRYDDGQREIGRNEIRIQLQAARTELQAARTAWQEQETRRQAEGLEQARQAAKETLRRLDKQQENQRAQDALLARVRSDRDALLAERDGLRLRASAYLDAAGCSSLAGDPALECVRQAARQVVDVLGRCSSRLVDLAAAADDARARGLKCEADYDALSKDAP